MMTGTITDDQARALAYLVSLLRAGRNGWDQAGVRAAIHKARMNADAHDLCVAAIRAAQNPTNRTPAVIAMDGPHWRTGGGELTRDLPAPRCDKPGHTSYPATNCGACRSEALQVDKVLPEPDPDVAAIASRGADRARRALAAALKEEA